MSTPVSAHELCQSVLRGRPVEAARLDRVLRIDAPHGVVEVQAGTPWRALAEALRPGDARTRAACTRRHTVGESIAWNAAGPDGRPLVAHVESLALVTPDGQLRRVDRIASPALFGLAVGGQGLFGALYSVTLRIESLLRAVTEAEPLQALERKAAAPPSGRLRLLVPPENLDSLLQEVRALCREWRMSVEAMEARRIRREEETYLRWAQREYAALSIAFAQPQRLGPAVRATQARRSFIEAAIARGGTFPIACTPEATLAQTEACYPQLAAFLAEQRRIDPAGRMANAWSRHYGSLLAQEPCAVRWNR